MCHVFSRLKQTTRGSEVVGVFFNVNADWFLALTSFLAVSTCPVHDAECAGNYITNQNVTALALETGIENETEKANIRKLKVSYKKKLFFFVCCWNCLNQHKRHTCTLFHQKSCSENLPMRDMCQDGGKSLEWRNTHVRQWRNPHCHQRKTDQSVSGYLQFYP